MNSKQLVTEPALCYCRVSRGREEEKKKSLDDQEHNCRKFADKNNLNVIKVYNDTTSGYTDIIQRTELTDLLNRCARDNIGHVIINDLQRFTRSFRVSIKVLDRIMFSKSGYKSISLIK